MPLRSVRRNMQAAGIPSPSPHLLASTAAGMGMGSLEELLEQANALLGGGNVAARAAAADTLPPDTSAALPPSPSEGHAGASLGNEWSAGETASGAAPGPGDVVGFDPGLAMLGLSFLGLPSLVGIAPGILGLATTAARLGLSGANRMGLAPSNLAFVDAFDPTIATEPAFPSGYVSFLGLNFPTSFVRGSDLDMTVDFDSDAGAASGGGGGVGISDGNAAAAAAASAGGEGEGTSWKKGGPIPGRGPMPATVHGGEFVVKEGPAKKYQAILRAINADRPARVKALANRLVVDSVAAAKKTRG